VEDNVKKDQQEAPEQQEQHAAEPGEQRQRRLFEELEHQARPFREG
jgi:hypothetical protein